MLEKIPCMYIYAKLQEDKDSKNIYLYIGLDNYTRGS